jgi:hypothetical protein
MDCRASWAAVMTVPWATDAGRKETNTGAAACQSMTPNNTTDLLTRAIEGRIQDDREQLQEPFMLPGIAGFANVAG